MRRDASPYITLSSGHANDHLGERLAFDCDNTVKKKEREHIKQSADKQPAGNNTVRIDV